MKRRYFVVVVWLIAAACGAAAQGQTRYLLRPTSPGVLNSVAQKFQLTPVEAVDGGGNVWVVTASSSRPPAQVEKEVDGDTAEVTDFELDQATTSPEVSQSTAAILDSLPAPGSTSYYGTNVLDFYTAQPAATLIRLADSLERSPDRDIQLAGCEIQDGWVQITLKAPREPDLAEWSAERVSGAFRQYYGCDIAVEYEPS